MSRDRIATVRKTGKRYLVQQVRFDDRREEGVADRVYCWGEVVEVRGLRRTHRAGGPIFFLSDVDVAEVVVDELLLQDLFEQTLAGEREAGATITAKGRKNRIYYTTRRGA